MSQAEAVGEGTMEAAGEAAGAASADESPAMAELLRRFLSVS